MVTINFEDNTNYSTYPQLLFGKKKGILIQQKRTKIGKITSYFNDKRTSFKLRYVR